MSLVHFIIRLLPIMSTVLCVFTSGVSSFKIEERLSCSDHKAFIEPLEEPREEPCKEPLK